MPSQRRGLAPVVSTLLLVSVVVVMSTLTLVAVFSWTDVINEGAPEAAFETERADRGVLITHVAGDTIDTSKLYVVYNGRATPVEDMVSTDELSAGDSVGPIDPNGASEVRLAWRDGNESYVVYVADDYTRLDFEGDDRSVPSVSAFSATNPADQDVRVSFDSTGVLLTITVAVTGAETAGLSEDDFTRNGDTYTATYAASTDGEVKYVDDPAGSPTVTPLTDEDGNAIPGDGGLGVVS